MQPIIMQDWITIRGTSTTTSIPMGQSSWVNSGPFQDMTFYLDVREFTGAAVTMFFETSPGKDEALFIHCIASFTVATGTTVKNCFLANATNPISNWTRWRLLGPGSTWDLSFRIMAAGNAVSG